ncbi:MAG: hypothetical protein D6759_02925, partial [Chloroflexi bacterium]
MASRAQDWLDQAWRDLEHARAAMANRPTTTRRPTADKPSAVRRRSFGSVQIAFLDREMAITELTEAAHRLLDQDDRVIAIGLFGSLARGDALPS